ncbi:MAG TPA: GNAT family N-acetyltransferase [Patescibacteria group bacterium]|nr:GNAT family N-acetyltransferase [Patescibacteria group bacterium]
MRERGDKSPHLETVTTTVYRRYPFSWMRIRRPVVAIDSANFGRRGLGRTYLKYDFRTRSHIAVLLKAESKKIIGYAVARPLDEVPQQRGLYAEPETAYVSIIALHPTVQGRRLASPLLDTLIDALRTRGYTHMELDARKRNGSAQKLIRHFGEAVEKKWTTYNQQLDENMKHLRVRIAN